MRIVDADLAMKAAAALMRGIAGGWADRQVADGRMTSTAGATYADLLVEHFNKHLFGALAPAIFEIDPPLKESVSHEGSEPDTILVCPERDARCPHGLDCPYAIDRGSCDIASSRAALAALTPETK